MCLAELQIQQAERQPQFVVQLLELIQAEQLDLNVRFAGALLFKNFIKKYWVPVSIVYLHISLIYVTCTGR